MLKCGCVSVELLVVTVYKKASVNELKSVRVAA